MERNKRLIGLIILNGCLLISKARLFEKSNFKIIPSTDVLAPLRFQRVIGVLNEANKLDKTPSIFIHNSKVQPSTKKSIHVPDPRDSRLNDIYYLIDRHDDKKKVVVRNVPNFFELDYEDAFDKHHGLKIDHEDHEKEFHFDDYDFNAAHDELLENIKPSQIRAKVLKNLLISDIEDIEETDKPPLPPVLRKTKGNKKQGIATKPSVEIKNNRDRLKAAISKKINIFSDGDDKIVNNNRFTVFSGSPRFNSLLKKWG